MRFILASLIFILAFDLQAATTVVIDPGHGGSDAGANRGSYKESRIVLKISRILRNYLKKDRNFEVYLTRSNNRGLSLKQRAQIVNSKEPDVFLSIHANSSLDTRTRGVEFYFQNQLPPDQESMFLAHFENKSAEIYWPDHPLIKRQKLSGNSAAIVEDLLRTKRIENSGILAQALYNNWPGYKRSKRSSVRQAPFYVISHVIAPSVLVEVGYLSNPQEAAKINTTAYQRKIARGIYRALKQFKDFVDKPAKNNLH